MELEWPPFDIYRRVLIQPLVIVPKREIGTAHSVSARFWQYIRAVAHYHFKFQDRQ